MVYDSRPPAGMYNHRRNISEVTPPRDSAPHINEASPAKSSRVRPGVGTID